MSPERKELLNRLNLLTEAEVLLLTGYDQELFMARRLRIEHR